jgi:lipid-binding SYLF domain-containing protein
MNSDTGPPNQGNPRSVGGKAVGETTMTQLSVGAQLGGQAYGEIIFFEDKRALDEFTGGSFEFSAEAGAVAITAGASAKTGSTGSAAGRERRQARRHDRR